MEPPLRDGALCPRDSNMGTSPDTHTGSLPNRLRVLNSIQTQTAITPEPLPSRPTAPQPCAPTASSFKKQKGSGDTGRWEGWTLVCSHAKLSSRAKRKNKKRRENTQQPRKRRSFLKSRVLTENPQLTSHSMVQDGKLFL